MTDAVRLIVADDHTLFRQGLKSLLRRRREFQVVAEVERASELAQTLASTPCDVLLLDLQMERWAIDDIEQFAVVTKVLVLTASEQIEDAIEKEFGFRPAVVVRSSADLKRIVEKNPFPKMAADDPSHLVVMLLAAKPGKAASRCSRIWLRSMADLRTSSRR